MLEIRLMIKKMYFIWYDSEKLFRESAESFQIGFFWRNAVSDFYARIHFSMGILSVSGS